MAQTHGNINFKEEFDNGSSGVAKLIDWNNGQHQKITLTDNCNITMTAPSNSNMTLRTLKVVQDITGTRLVTWPVNVKWAGVTPPTLTTAGLGYDIITFRWDGTNYDSVESLNFG